MCEVQYDLFSQYQVAVDHASSLGPFTLALQTCIVKNKIKEANEYRVHISPTLIYCPCGYIFTNLLPCRHVLAANNLLFADIFQAGQYHPRWWFEYSSTMEQRLLSKQFWISIGKEVTKEGVCQARMLSKDVQEEKQEKEEGLDSEERKLPMEGYAAAAASAVVDPQSGYASFPRSKEVSPDDASPNVPQQDVKAPPKPPAFQ